MKRLLSLVLLLLCSAGCRAGGDFPNRPIFLLCPWGAGGGTDRISRQVAVLLEQDLGVSVNVINATGGQGVTGHSRGAQARPDGYTLTMMTVELNMLHWRGLTDVTHQNFVPLALLNRDAAALFVRADAPWATLAELEEHIRTSAEPLTASGTAQGGIWHLALAGWYTVIGESPDRLRWLSSQGAASSLTELMAGTIDVVVCGLPEAAVQMASGKVRSLGVMSPERVTPRFPDVPTFEEQGYDWSLGAWRAVGVPRDTPAQVQDVLVPALERVVGSPEFEEFMARQGFDWRYEAPELARLSLVEADEALGALITSDAFGSIRSARFGAMVYPGLLAVGFVLSFLGLAFSGELKRRKAVASGREGWVHFAEGLGMIALFILLVRPVGFVLTAGLLLALLFWRLGVAPWRAALLSALVVPGAYAVFHVLLRVDLPRGFLGW